MKLNLFILLGLLTFSIYSQPLLPFPETLEIESWDGSQWSPPSTTEYTFNVNCLYTLSLAQTATGENFLKVIGTYIDDLYPDVFLFQFWDVVNNQWLDVARADYTYNNNVLDYITTFSWTNNMWVEVNKQLFMFNVDDLFSEYIYQEWDPIDNQWNNLSKTLYTYLSNNTEDTRTIYAWNETSSDWDLDRREVYNYASGLLDFIQIENWESNQWNNGRYEEFIYDTDDNIIEWVLLDWQNGSYENQSQRLYSDFLDGAAQTMIQKSWQNGNWLNLNRESRVYPDCLNLSNDDFSQENVSLYPNPAESEVFIDVFENAEYILTNINGQLLRDGLFLSGNNSIDLTGLNRGIYLLKISAEKGFVVRKIIKK